MKHFGDLREQTNMAGIDFLMTDIATACTFLDVADTTAVEETRARNCENARTAYHTIVRLVHRVVMSTEQKQDFESSLDVLRHRLSDLGLLDDSSLPAQMASKLA